MVEEYARTHDDVVYADLATPMMGEDRRPRDTLFLEDGLHLNETGYDVWTKALRPVLDEVLRGVQK
jgi:lysophospholipase L1-like esterase